MQKSFLFVIFLIICFEVLAQSTRILVPFRKGVKWGYSDTLGHIKIRPVWDSVALFDYTGITRKNRVLANVWLNGKQAVVNDIGRIVVSPKYDGIMPINQLKDFAFIVSSNNKAGLFTKGKEIIPTIYDWIELASQAYFKVHKQDKYGLIDDTGKLVIPILYDDIQESRTDSGLIKWEAITYGKEAKFYSLKASSFYPDALMAPQPDRIAEDMDVFADGRQTIGESVKKEQGLDSIWLNGNSGIAFKDGKQGVFLPKEAKQVYFFSKNYTVHRIKYFNPVYRHTGTAAYIVASLNGKWRMINESEQQILPFAYDSIEEKEGIFILNRNGKIGFFIWNTIYPVIQPAYDKLLWKDFLRVNYQWSFILFKVMKNGKSGFVGENGVAFFTD